MLIVTELKARRTNDEPVIQTSDGNYVMFNYENT